MGTARATEQRRKLRPFLLFRVLANAVIASILATAVWTAITWPDIGMLAHHRPGITAFMRAYRHTAPAARFAWTWVPYDQISPEVKKAVLVAEDARFFEHRGVEPSAVRESFLAWVGRRPARAGSTITQQLVKNLWLTASRSPLRKAKEIVLAHQTDLALGKRRILEIYLNVVEFGPGVYGVEAAARSIFGRGAATLGAEEAARLAALLPAPHRWFSARTDPDYLARVSIIRTRAAAASGLDRSL